MNNQNSTPSQSLSWRTLSLRTKLVTAFLVVTIVPLVIVSFITYNSSRTALTNDANQKLQAAAHQTAASVDSFIEFNLESVRAAGQFPAVVDYVSLPASQRAGSPEEQRIRKFIAAMARQDPVYISSVAVFDTNGITLADTTAADIGSDKSSRQYFQITMETQLPYASDVEHSSTTGAPSIYFSAPIHNASGSTIGVLRIRYFATILQTLIVDNTGLAGESSYAVLLDSNHIRLAHGTDRNRLYKSIVPLNASLLQDLQSKGLMRAGTPEELSTNLTDFEAGLNDISNNPYFAADTNGDAGLEQGTTATLATKPNWQVVFVQSQNVFLQPITAQTTNTILVALFIALVTGVIGFVFSQTLAGPIIRLTQTAETVAAGSIETQAKVETGDEIGTLAIAFNRMTAQLREFIQTLEQRVADRTKALATSTEVSRRLSTILDQKQLVTEVVNQVNNAFGYYHTQIYFFDANNENLVMAGGTGEAGKMMLAQFHKVLKGRGLVGRAADTNEAVLVRDTKQNPEWLPNPLLPDTKSEMAVPISLGDEVLGVLDVQHNITGGLQQEDVDTIKSIANQIAIALQNIRQYENTRKIASDMGVVAAVGIATSTITETTRLLQEVVDLSKKSFNLYHAHIYLMNEAGDRLLLTSGAGEIGQQMVSEQRSIPLDSEQSLVARCARTGEGVVVNDVTVAPDFLANPLLPDTRSEMAVPMIVAGKVIGVLDVQSETVGRFTQVDVSIKTTLASQIAIALQNARNFAQSKQQAERETAVNTITQRIQSATNVEAALQIAARELGHVLGKRQTLVSLDLASLKDAAKVASNE